MTRPELPIARPAAPTPPEPTDPFRWRVVRRPLVLFGHAIGGAAGVFLVAAVIALVAEITDDDATLAGVACTVGLVALALLAGYSMRGPVRSAAVTAIALSIPTIWLFVVAGNGEPPGRGDFRLVMLLSLACYVLFYLATWTRGRAVLLGLALLFAATWLVFEVASQDAPLASGLARTVPLGGVAPGFDGGAEPDDNLTATGLANLAVGVVLLGAGLVADRRRSAGVATPCLLVGGLHAVSAALLLGIDARDVYVTGLLVVGAGLAIGLAGSFGRRRGTSWLGAIVLAAGVVTLVGKVTADVVGDDGGGEGELALFALLGAAAMLALGTVIARAAAEPVDGGEPAPPAPQGPTPQDPPPQGPTPQVPTLEGPVPEGPTPEGSTPPVSWSAPATKPGS
jgi:hypothetical protein